MQIVYVLESLKDRKLYIGCSSDIEKRLTYHSLGKVRSTKNRRPFKIVYLEKFEDKYEAFFTESFYKTAKGKKELQEKIKNWGVV
jgi:putative endonuclease